MKKVVPRFGRFEISPFTNDFFFVRLDPELPLETRAHPAFQREWKEGQIKRQPHLEHRRQEGA
jgi:hypothetical protein